METLDNLVLREIEGGKKFEVVDSITFKGQRQDFVVPAGFVTDLASIPRVLQWFIPKLGAHNKAAVLHDALWLVSEAYKKGWLVSNQDGSYTWDETNVSFAENMLVDPVDVDGLFRRAMRDLGVAFPKRWLMWAAVRAASIVGGRTGQMPFRIWAQLAAVIAAVSAPFAAIAGWLTTGFGL